jgi:hypothetical protein
LWQDVKKHVGDKIPQLITQCQQPVESTVMANLIFLKEEAWGVEAYPRSAIKGPLLRFDKDTPSGAQLLDPKSDLWKNVLLIVGEEIKTFMPEGKAGALAGGASEPARPLAAAVVA